MTTDPLACKWTVGGFQIAEALCFYMSRFGGGFSPRPLAGGAFTIHWLTPDLVRNGLSTAVGTFVTFAVTGSFIGQCAGRSGRSAGELGAQLREIVKLNILIENHADGLRFAFAGELAAETHRSAVSSSPPLSASEFSVEFTLPDASLESAIQDADAPQLAAEILRLRRRALAPGSGLIIKT
jgi:hypothetical protein